MTLVGVFAEELEGFCQKLDLDPECVTISELLHKIQHQNALLVNEHVLEMTKKLVEFLVPIQDEQQQQSLDKFTSQETKERINSFIKWKRAQINTNNLTEFFVTDNPQNDSSCARIKARCPNSTSNIQRAVVENWEGPLDRATTNSQNASTSQSFGNSSDDPMTRHLTLKETPSSMQQVLHERLLAIEAHLNSSSNDDHSNSTKASVSQEDLASRIKIIEQKIMQIEKNYPFLAAYHFNYQQSPNATNLEAKNRPQASTQLSASKPKVPKITNDETYNKLVRLKRNILG